MSEIFQFKNSKFENIEDCVKYIREDCGNNVAGKEFVIEQIIPSNDKDIWGTYSETRQEIVFRLEGKKL